VTCFPGKYLNGKNCVSLFTVTRNIRYRMELIIKGTLPQYHAYYVLYFLQLTTKSIHPWLTQFLTTASIGAVDLRMLRTLLFSNLPCRCCSSEMTNTTILVHLSVDLFISSYINRYNLEKILTEIDGLPFNFSDIIFDDTTNDFSIYRANIIKHKVNDKSWNSDKCWWSYIWSANMNDFGDKYIATFVSRQILCQQYEFEPDEYVYDAIKDEMRLLQFNVRLKPEEFLRGNDGKVKICVDDLLKYLSKTSPISKSTTELALEILTTVCSCVSMLCLLLTFVTYCCYDSLRTLPGKNNMCLILSLFIAQTCLQFGTIWTNYVTVCKVVGVVLHISWLATFGCMNVCSFHMYNTFKKVKAIKVDRSETNKLLLRYISFSFGVPICIVIVNMAVHLGQSKGRNIGYGVDACFISRRLSQVVSFIIPVVLICIVNVCLFTITAWKIHSRPKIQSTRNDRNDFFVYVKLFALTGITWLGQIIDSFFPLSLFSFVVTLLTGLQGLFIFLSYICNKRILNMISTSLHCQKSNATKSCDNQLSSSDSTKSSSLSRESSSNTFLPVDSSKL